MMTRAEHLQWSKDRALELLDAGNPEQALTSMFSDLTKHRDTRGHIGMQLGMGMLVADGIKDVRAFILGFN